MKPKSTKAAIPVSVKEEALRAIEHFNTKELDGTGYRYIPRFKGACLYLDRDDFGTIGHICRLKYMGPEEGWNFAIYKYSNERYDEQEWLFPGSDWVDGTVEGALKAGMEAYH